MSGLTIATLVISGFSLGVTACNIFWIWSSRK